MDPSSKKEKLTYVGFSFLQVVKNIKKERGG